MWIYISWDYRIFHDKYIGLFTIKRKFKKWVCLECQLVLRELLAMKLKQLCSCTVRINRYGLKITGTDWTLGIVVCGHHYEEKVWLYVRRCATTFVDTGSGGCWKFWCRIYRMGPNYVWHIDGFDNLKPYGFNIHGCINGHSRRMIYSEVSAFNKCPDLIAYYYLKVAKKLNGIPKIR